MRKRSSTAISHIEVMYHQNPSHLVALLLEFFPFMINKFHKAGYLYLGDFSQWEKFYSYQPLLCMYIKRDVCESIKSTLDLVHRLCPPQPEQAFKWVTSYLQMNSNMCVRSPPWSKCNRVRILFLEEDFKTGQFSFTPQRVLLIS